MVSNAGNGVPAKVFRLHIDEDGDLVVEYAATRGPCLIHRQILDLADWLQFLKSKENELRIHGLSADIEVRQTDAFKWAERFTDKEDVLALVKELRGDTT